MNSTSCQVYIGLKKGCEIPDIGDLIFTSEAPSFSTEELTDFNTTSRTFSVYYPDTRPERKEPRYSIVASINAKWKDWQNLTNDEYEKEKNRLCEESVDALETRERLLDVESLMSGDKYSFVRDAYMQSMEYEIKDGIDVEDEFVDDMEDFLIDQ